MWDPYAEFKSVVLPNGLTIYAAHWPGRPWEQVAFQVHSGAEHDPVGMEGLAHFVEHVVSENVSLSNQEIKIFFEGYGGGCMLGSTGYPSTQYGFFVPAEKSVMARACSIFGQMLFAAKLEKAIEREREVILGEFHRKYRMECDFKLNMREREALYAGYWLERTASPLGSPISIKRIAQNDLQSFYDNHYTPTNMSIVGVGGMSLTQLADVFLESPLAMDKKGMRTSFPMPVVDVAPPTENRYVFNLAEHLTDVSSIHTGSYRSVAKLPGNFESLAVRLLNGMLNKVLNEEVRERRAWTYSIGSDYHDFRHFYEFSVSCGSFALSAIDRIEEVIEACIDSVGNQDDLLEQVKGRILASNSMIDFTGGDLCNYASKDIMNSQRITSLAEDNKIIEGVTMDDIRNLLQWLRPERRWTRIMKP